MPLSNNLGFPPIIKNTLNLLYTQTKCHDEKFFRLSKYKMDCWNIGASGRAIDDYFKQDNIGCGISEASNSARFCKMQKLSQSLQAISLLSCSL